jgi:nucleotide-binding universal stress UspA family protein
MEILICVKKSALAEKMLMEAKVLIEALHKSPVVKVIHVMDDAMSKDKNGFDNKLKCIFRRDNLELIELVKSVFGTEIKYYEEYGDPKYKLVEIIKEWNSTVVILGSGSFSGKSQFKTGIAEFVMRSTSKPVLIIPENMY